MAINVSDSITVGFSPTLYCVDPMLRKLRKSRRVLIFPPMFPPKPFKTDWKV